MWFVSNRNVAQRQFLAAHFQTPGVLSLRLAHLQVDDSVCAVSLHGIELQVPLEVLGVEARDGQTVAEASLHRHTEGLGRLCSLSHCKQQRSPMQEQTGLESSLYRVL